MANNHTQGVPSRAAIIGHPIHPILVSFPIAFLIGALLTDLAYWWTAEPYWARNSLWLVGAGLVSGSLAAPFGLIDFLTIGRAREHTDGWLHFIGNATVLALTLISVISRWSNPTVAVLPWGLGLSALTAVLLIITGWFGGELAYRHMIGVTGHNGQLDAETTELAGEPHHH